MTPLEIILVCVLSAVVLLIEVYLLLVFFMKENKRDTFNMLNTKAKKGQIVFFGDSLTDFMPMELIDNAIVYNRGIAAETTNDLLKRMENVLDLQPKKVFLLIGTNDLAHGKNPEQIVSNTAKICKILRDNLNGVEIFILSQYPITRTKNIYSPVCCLLRSNKRLVEINNLLRQLCKEQNYTYIDIYNHLADDKGRMKKDLTLEGLHLSTKGYLLVTGILKKYLD